MVNKISLAPMVRMNTLPFRLLAYKEGADYVYSEEIIDKKLIACVPVENALLNTIDYVQAKDYSLVLRIKQEEKEKFILQIGTNCADTAVRAVERLLPHIGGVDVNMGCPKKFSVQGGMGSALMRDLENASRIMKALVDRFSDRISVSCKIRVLKNYEDTLQYVLSMQATGIHWIAIHPRTAAEESAVPAKWYITKKILNTGLIKIPVLGSGDLFSPLDVHKFISFTGASGVILARGAIHNPAIFRLKARLLNSSQPLMTLTTTSSDEGAAQLDEDWKDNTVEPIQVVPSSIVANQSFSGDTQCCSEEAKVPKKSKASSGDADYESIEFSKNLVKVFDRRYSRLPMEVDILDQVKEYFKLSIETGNNHQNTKYCMLYMLKTHKEDFDLFKKIHGAKNLAEYAKALEMEHLFEGLAPEYFQHFDGTFYRKNKHLVDFVVEKERKAQMKDGVEMREQAGYELESIEDIEMKSQTIKRIKTNE